MNGVLRVLCSDAVQALAEVMLRMALGLNGCGYEVEVTWRKEGGCACETGEDCRAIMLCMLGGCPALLTV